MIENQNNQNNIDLLCAQRQFYSDSKFFNLCNFSITVPVICALYLIRVFWKNPEFAAFVGFYAILALVVSLILSSAAKSKQARAAAIQEKFDVEVLDLPTNSFHSDEEEDVIIEAAKKHKEKHSEDTLKDWYPSIIANQDKDLSTAICQSINTKWDTRLRSRYLNFQWGILSIFTLVVVSISFFLKTPVQELLLHTLLPLMAGLRFLIATIIAERSTQKNLTKIRSVCSSRIERLIEREEPSATAREVQDEIYRHRKSASSIPDWFFNKFKSKDHATLTAYTQNLINRFNSNG